MVRNSDLAVMMLWSAGETVHEIGRGIHDLCLWAKKPEKMPVKRGIFVRDIVGFYLMGSDGNQSLTDVMPAHLEGAQTLKRAAPHR